MAYDIKAAAARLLDGEQRPIADLFSMAYLRRGLGKRGTRPIIFFFPGGPGSAASGLDIGGFGPRVMDYPEDPATRAMPVLRENPRSLLDLADLVFVDMPGVGFSRLLPDGRAAHLNGIRSDAKMHAAFVRSWLSGHERLDDPIFLAGKSYGVIRASYTALQLTTDGAPVRLVGLILLSGAWDAAAMDFADSFTPDGDLSAYWSFLPTYAAIAWHYGKVNRRGRFEDFIERARQFALDDYAPALLRGERLSLADRERLARRMSSFIGLPAPLIRAHGGRISTTTFRENLLPGQPLGFDNASFAKDHDPDEFGGDHALDQAWQGYLREIGFSEAEAYVTGSYLPAVHWDWLASDVWRMGYPKATQALKPLAAAKPELQLFIAAGYFDLATAFFMAENSAAQPGMPQDRIVLKHYPSGHSLWVHPPTREALTNDVRAFVTDCLLTQRD